jgi:hypothetical protein
MASPSDAQSGTNGGGSGDRGGGASASRTDLEGFFDQLDLNEEEFEDVVIDEDDPEIQESTRWLALARVHTGKTFSQSAFYKDMRAAWNPAQRVRFRPVGPNRFVVQASCLGDWERIMQQGPWLFRTWAVLLCPYDGFTKTEEVSIVHMPIWLQIHKLPDVYCKKNIVEKLLKGAGEIMEMRLEGNIRGDYVRIRVKHDITTPLTKYVSIVRGGARQVFLVRYEKLAKFCSMCGLVGHEFKECGSGIHEEKDMKFGVWLYADAPNKPRVNSHSTKEYTADRSKNVHVKAQAMKAPAGQGKKGVDPVLMDTASSPVKTPGCSLEQDKIPRKRLNMDEADGHKAIAGSKLPLLTITDGSGEDLKEDKSPTSSSSSKRARVSLDGENPQELAASLEEGRPSQ